MGFSLTFKHWFVYVMVLLPALCYSSHPQDGFVQSRATYYRTRDGLGTPSGSCGFGQYGRTVYDGKVTAVSSQLYNNGIGCGACYQVRCTNPRLCSDNGVNVVVTDNGEGDGTDFILSSSAFAGMARAGSGSQLFPYGVVDVEYKRIPCEYLGHNIQVKVTKDSRNPNYLAIILLYQGGKSDILGIEILQRARRQWIGMRRVYGAVFDLANPPMGDLTLRFQVAGSDGLEWMYASNAIPAYWKAGGAYETYVQLD